MPKSIYIQRCRQVFVATKNNTPNLIIKEKEL